MRNKDWYRVSKRCIVLDIGNQIVVPSFIVYALVWDLTDKNIKAAFVMSFDSFMSIKLSKCYSMFLLDHFALLITFLKRATIVFSVLLLVGHYCTIPVWDFKFIWTTLFLRMSFSSSGSSKIKCWSSNDAIPWSDVIITFVYS